MIDRVHEAHKILDTIPKAPRFTWEFKQRAFAQHIIQSNGNLDKFLEWSSSYESLHTGFTRDAKRELELIPEEMRQYGTDPSMGAPSKSPVGMSGTYIRQLFLASKIGHANSIFEFGGGYGALAVVLNRWYAYHPKHYVYDFPVIHMLREWYLSCQGMATVSITQPTELDVEVFVSACALDEAPLELRETILDLVTAERYVFVFTHDFGGYDNTKFFNEWASRREWRQRETIETGNPNQACLILG